MIPTQKSSKNAFKPPNTKGFTLLEVLVASAIFAVISIMAYRALDLLSSAQHVIRERNAEDSGIARVFSELSQDFMRHQSTAPMQIDLDQSSLYLQSRSIASVGNAPETIIVLFRSSHEPIGLVGEGGVARVEYRLSRDGRIERSYFEPAQAFNPTHPGYEFSFETLMHDVQGVGIRALRNADDRGLDSWQYAESPFLVTIEVQDQDGNDFSVSFPTTPGGVMQ